MKHKVYMNYIHSSSMLSYFSELWKNGNLCDTVITVDSMVVAKAHRLVLLAASPKLQADHASSLSPLISDVCLPTNVSKDSIDVCLSYIYDGVLELNEENISDVKKIAEYLQIEQLLHCCIDFSESIVGGSDKLPDINKTFHIKKSNLMGSTSQSSTKDCKKCSNQCSAKSSFKPATSSTPNAFNTNSNIGEMHSDNSSNALSSDLADISSSSTSNSPHPAKRQKLFKDTSNVPSTSQGPVTLTIDDDEEETLVVKTEPVDSEFLSSASSEPYPISFMPNSHVKEDIHDTGVSSGHPSYTVPSSSQQLEQSPSPNFDAESSSGVGRWDSVQLGSGNKPRPGILSSEIAHMYNMAELVPGSSVFVYPTQILEATQHKCGKTMARFLLSCFYSTAELVAAGNLTGFNNKKGLSSEIIAAIIGFCVEADPVQTAADIRKILRNKVSAHSCMVKRRKKIRTSSRHNLTLLID